LKRSTSYPAKVLTGEGKEAVAETRVEIVNIRKSCLDGDLILFLLTLIADSDFVSDSDSDSDSDLLTSDR